jgi:hypothetical protein
VIGGDDPGHRDPRWFDDPSGGPGPDDPDRGDPDGDESPSGPGRLLWLLVGAAAIAGGTALGWDSSALDSVVNPPTLIRAALIGLGVAIGIVLLLGALERLGASPGDTQGLAGGRDGTGRSTRDVATMIRGVRLVFLAVAAFAAASAWLLGHPLPLVIALVIAGVDVLETSFLLLVVSLRTRR